MNNLPIYKNLDIVKELTGNLGLSAQMRAFEELSKYLYIIALEYLWRRKNNVVYLSSLPNMDIESYAEDFAQEALLKLAEDKFRRLAQYTGEGKFTSWAAQVVINCIRDELRDADWHRQTLTTDRVQRCCDTNPFNDPERQIVSAMINERVHVHLGLLSPKGRTAITRCLVEDLPIAEVAAEMELSTNALYIQLSRGKAALRTALSREGITPG